MTDDPTNVAPQLTVLVATGAVPTAVRDGGFGSGAEVEQHGKRLDKVVDVIKVDGAEVLESWQHALETVRTLFGSDEASARAGAFRVETITASLALSGSGKVAFVGELGVEATFEVTFQRV